MLSEITIENVAVIEKATARFAQGFTVLTGETGAGKSILIDSINAIMGNRTSREIVRNEAQRASIWACFEDVPFAVTATLQAAGYTAEGDLLLQREVTRGGKSSGRIGGAPATAGILREVCGALVDIHGQHDNQSLMNPAKHLGILDAFAQNEALLQDYRLAYERLTALRREMLVLDMDEGEKTRRLELLRHEVGEIEAAGLYAGEEDELAERRNVIRNAQAITDALNTSYMALNGGDEETGAATMLGEASRSMSNAAAITNEYRDYADKLDEIYYNVQEIASGIQAEISGFEYGGMQADALEERLDTLYRLKQKYGQTVEDVLAYGEQAQKELESIEFSTQRLEKVQEEERAAAKQALELAQKLTQGRQKAFEALKAAIAQALDFLNMPGIAMTLRHKVADLGPGGQDDLELLISTNPGELPKPLAKIASGGELARIMLAIKSALADRDEMPTVIYDEIDTGVSGLAAGRIGQLLRDTANDRQVICVTHTAQIAAYAQRHLLIEKSVEGGRAYTRIRELEGTERVEELARIMSGDAVTDAARANAREMLEMAQRPKKTGA